MVRAAAEEDPWERRHAQELAEDLAIAQQRLTRAVLDQGADDADQALEALEHSHAEQVEAYRDLLDELGSDAPLAGYALAVRHVRGLARG